MYGVDKHHQYLYGRKFILRSDHKALSYIFAKNKGLPLTAASRLQRYAVKLAAYNFDIEYVSSAQNSFADSLSRLPLDAPKKHTKNEFSFFNYVQDNLPVSFSDIKREVTKDSLLNKIYGYVMFGWPTKTNSDEEKPYFSRKEGLHIEHGCLIWGYRIVVPKSLRSLVLKEIHSGHPGIVKMKQIARNYVWWDGLDGDLERVTRECAACVSQWPQPAPAPLHSWPWPTTPWDRLNLDFLGPLGGSYYLVVIDAHSKWIEVEKVASTGATVVINRLRTIFARFGLPRRLITDNGPPFSSAEFSDYLKKNGISHTLVAPYHPASNGAAENAVRTIKRVLKKAILENENDNVALSKFLFSYRNTEHSTTKREPAVALLGHRLRGRLDLLRPNTSELVRVTQERSENASAGKPLREPGQGERVLVRDYSKNATKWAEGKILQRSGPVTYKVKTADDRIHKRHIDQILSSPNHQRRMSRYSVDMSLDLQDQSKNGVISDLPDSLIQVEQNNHDDDDWEDAAEDPRSSAIENESGGIDKGGGMSGSSQSNMTPKLMTQRQPSPSIPQPHYLNKRKAAVECKQKLHDMFNNNK